MATFNAPRRSLYQLRLNWLDGSVSFSRVFHSLKEAREALIGFADVGSIYSVELEAF